jgi:N-acetylglucosaminyl-diphospho-decaprenol L-rhamnosyltransferase
MVTASIVSHGHGIMVRGLVEDLLGCPEVARVVVTQNVSEKTEYPEDGRVEVIRNTQPQGYGANQNAAFTSASSPFFCVLNPDVRLKENPFPALLTVLKDARVAASAPVIVTPENDIEDSARSFPTAMSLVGKALGLSDGAYLDTAGTQNPDWLAGMFLLVRSSAFREVGGFDEKYFLYYEDVDLGWRLRRRGYELRQVHEVRAVHAARRASRRDWQHAQWHLASMARFLLKESRG